MQQSADIIVIGAGIAGVSAAAELAAYADVMLLEMCTSSKSMAPQTGCSILAGSKGAALPRPVSTSTFQKRL